MPPSDQSDQSAGVRASTAGPQGQAANASGDRPVDHRRVFQQAPDPILVVDEQGRYIDANQAACDLTGFTRDELLAKRVGDLTVPEERSVSAERFDLLRRTGRTRRERTLLRKDGTRVTVEAHATELGDGTFQTTLRDVSERVVAREQLQRSLDAYSTLLELCHAAVISTGPDGRVASWNPGAQAIFGYAATEAIGMALTDLIPERHRSGHIAAFSRHVNAPPSAPINRTLNMEGLRKDGSEIPIEISIAVGTQRGGPVFTAVIRDITNDRIVLEKLNDALQRLQFHVERMPLAYIVWDVDFRVVEWNPSAERIFGYSRDQAIGRHAYDLIVPRDAISTVDTIWDDLLRGDTSSHSINANVRMDGSRLTCEWFNTPLRDSHGRIRGVASMAMDVSEREAMEARIRDAQKLESLGVMAGGIAHDFNSSLMVMLGNTALLRSIKRMPPRAIEHLELIEEAGARADELIKHLLWYARTGRHRPQATNLNAVVGEALPFIRSSIGNRHKIDVTLGDGLPTILADRSQVEQILLNLCLNARDAMDDGGGISLVTRRTELSQTEATRCVPHDAKAGQYVELAVTDSGRGMDDSTMVRVFDPFFTTKADGHGLGLAAVLGILRQHGAAARIDSARQRGTTVHVFFPVMPKPQEAEAP